MFGVARVSPSGGVVGGSTPSPAEILHKPSTTTMEEKPPHLILKITIKALQCKVLNLHIREKFAKIQEK